MAYLTNGKMVRNIAHVAVPIRQLHGRPFLAFEKHVSTCGKEPGGTHLAVTCCFVLGTVPFSPIAGAGLHKAASGGGKASAAG